MTTVPFETRRTQLLRFLFWPLGGSKTSLALVFSANNQLHAAHSDKLSNETVLAKIMSGNKFYFTINVDLPTIFKYLRVYQKNFPELHRMDVPSLVIGISSA